MMRAVLAAALLCVACEAEGPYWPITKPYAAPPCGGDAGCLDPEAVFVYAVSPDGERALVSHSQVSPDLNVARRDAPPRSLARWVHSASFSPDSRLILYTSDDGAFLTDADGGSLRMLAPAGFGAQFAGRWIYLTSADTLERVAIAGGVPEAIAKISPYLLTSISPDGDAVAYCGAPGQCWLYSGGVTRALSGADYAGNWSADGSWFQTAWCAGIDRSGALISLCSGAQWFAPSPDGSRVVWLDAAFGVHVRTVATGAEIALPAPGPFDLHMTRPPRQVTFTPDGARVIAQLGRSVFTAPAEGGVWTTITTEGWLMSVAPHIVAAASDGELVESIDGAAPRAVVGPNGAQAFEVLFDKTSTRAIFSNTTQAWLANADGSGAWQPLTSNDCSFAAADVICRSGNVLEGSTGVKLTDDVRQSVITPHRLFFVSRSGGLATVDL